MCINKYDINLDNTKEIQKHCIENNIEIVGKLPYDITMTKAMVEEKSIIEFSNGILSKKISEMWDKIKEELNQ